MYVKIRGYTINLFEGLIKAPLCSVVLYYTLFYEYLQVRAYIAMDKFTANRPGGSQRLLYRYRDLPEALQKHSGNVKLSRVSCQIQPRLTYMATTPIYCIASL